MSSSHSFTLTHVNLPLKIGLYDWERQNLQPVSFDIRFSFHLADNYVDGCMKTTVNYEPIVLFLKKELPQLTFCTLEAVARFVADFILSLPSIYECCVKVTKYKVCQGSCDVTYSLSQSQNDSSDS